MQKLQKELLLVFQPDISGYSEMMLIITIGVQVTGSRIVKAVNVMEVTAISGTVEASVSAFSTVGVKMAVKDENASYKQQDRYVSLVEEDCSLSDNKKAKDISKIIGEQHDFSEKYGGRSDENVLPTILGDLRGYNAILLGSDSAKKHAFEGRWIPKNSTEKGRMGVFKSMFLTVVTLRETATTEREIELFKQLYMELCKLSELCSFSKTRKNRNATYSSTTEGKNFEASGSIEVSIPYAGPAGLGFVTSNIEGHPFVSMNGNYMVLKGVLPLFAGGIMGISTMQSKLSEMSEKLIGKSGEKDGVLSLSSALITGSDAFKGLVLCMPFPLISSPNSLVLGSSECSIKMKRVEKSDLSKTIIALPGDAQALIKDKDSWTVQYMQCTAYIHTSLSGGVGVMSAAYTQSIGKLQQFIGTDTLSHLTNRFNAYAIGFKELSKKRLSTNTLWVALKTEHAGRLCELLINVDNRESNVRYELQDLYNLILSKSKQNQKASIEDAFSTFLTDCHDLSEASDDDKSIAYNNAISSFDKIMELYMQFVGASS